MKAFAAILTIIVLTLAGYALFYAGNAYGVDNGVPMLRVAFAPSEPRMAPRLEPSPSLSHALRGSAQKSAPKPQAPENKASSSPDASGLICNSALLSADGLDRDHVISREACDLVNNLFASGHVAGNAGDAYDNRDGLHVNLCVDWTPNQECPADHRLFPQHAWIFSGAIGAATGVHPGITVGQASWAGFSQGYDNYSIPHKLYMSQEGASELYQQYVHSNLYIYPSLNDDEFKGDPNDTAVMADPTTLDPASKDIANTPYTIASKQIALAGTDYYHIHNASGSDLPFVKLVLLALGSLRPDVKAALQNGPTIGGDRISFVMPVVQLLLRNAHRTVNSRSDYLESSIVHRSMDMAHYLSGGLPQPGYDPAKLVRLANSLTTADVPPLVQLKVISEDFAPNERLFDTPGAIARDIPYGVKRTITVSAAGSVDLDGSTSGHEYVWRLIDSDPTHASIIVDPKDSSKATISFMPGQATDRIDVGVFVRKQNGAYYSVPGIVSAHFHP